MIWISILNHSPFSVKDFFSCILLKSSPPSMLENNEYKLIQILRNWEKENFMLDVKSKIYIFFFDLNNLRYWSCHLLNIFTTGLWSRCKTAFGIGWELFCWLNKSWEYMLFHNEWIMKIFVSYTYIRFRQLAIFKSEWFRIDLSRY